MIKKILKDIDVYLEAVIYDHFPADNDCFKENVCSEYTQDELRESCKNKIKVFLQKTFEEQEKKYKGKEEEWLQSGRELLNTIGDLKENEKRLSGKEIREYLWMNHSYKNEQCCPYGDDGEMQCCGMDFKKQDISVLIKNIYKIRNNKAIIALQDKENK